MQTIKSFFEVYVDFEEEIFNKSFQAADSQEYLQKFFVDNSQLHLYILY